MLFMLSEWFVQPCLEVAVLDFDHTARCGDPELIAVIAHEALSNY